MFPAVVPETVCEIEPGALPDRSSDWRPSSACQYPEVSRSMLAPPIVQPVKTDEPAESRVSSLVVSGGCSKLPFWMRLVWAAAGLDETAWMIGSSVPARPMVSRRLALARPRRAVPWRRELPREPKDRQRLFLSPRPISGVSSEFARGGPTSTDSLPPKAPLVVLAGHINVAYVGCLHLCAASEQRSRSRAASGPRCSTFPSPRSRGATPRRGVILRGALGEAMVSRVWPLRAVSRSSRTRLLAPRTRGDNLAVSENPADPSSTCESEPVIPGSFRLALQALGDARPLPPTLRGSRMPDLDTTAEHGREAADHRG